MKDLPLTDRESRRSGTNTPLPTSTHLNPLDFQGDFFIVGQILGLLGQGTKSNYLLFLMTLNHFV